MAESKLIQFNKKVTQSVTNGFGHIQQAVVETYVKIEDRFVARYLTREGETVEDAKLRLKQDRQN